MFTSLSVSLKGHSRRVNACQAALQETQSKKVLIVGGTGRVGSSTALSLSKSVPDVELTLAGRSRANYENFSTHSPLRNTKFLQLDIEDDRRLRDAVGAADLVIHAAGPFQRRDRCHVLEAAVEVKTAYLDVCDDVRYAQMAKQIHPLAVRQGVPAIVGGGVYPGLSNIMAAHVISTNKQEYDEDGFHKQGEPDADVTSVERVRYSYFTAGSGGAGKSLLVTSLMLLGESVVLFQNDNAVKVPPMSQPADVDFGPGIGVRGAYLLNLPEVVSAHEIFGACNASARFGTAPQVWNWLLWAMARNVDPTVLQDRESMTKLASFSWPITRFVDQFVGEAVAMRVDIDFDGGKSAAGVYVHKRLSESLGTCVSAFAQCLLNGETEAGVWCPEEKQAIRNRKKFLTDASKGCQRLILNRPAWQIETDPVRIGLGMYVY